MDFKIWSKTFRITSLKVKARKVRKVRRVKMVKTRKAVLIYLCRNLRLKLQ